MTKIVIIGGGNVAFHITKALLKATAVSVIQVYNRSLKAIKHFEKKVSITDDINKLVKADLYIICVSDDSIKEIANKIQTFDALIVHTSGSTSMNVLQNHKRIGVFYPLQSFSKDRKINFKKIPICVESNTNDDLRVIHNLASTLSKNVHEINSTQRQQLHIAAVFVNNFTNHLYTIGTDICHENSIEPEILLPLIQETAKKINKLTPFKAQTGPARRGDNKVIKNHLEKLTSNHREIYKLLSQSIANKYGKKL